MINMRIDGQEINKNIYINRLEKVLYIQIASPPSRPRITTLHVSLMNWPSGNDQLLQWLQNPSLGVPGAAQEV